MTLPSSDRMAGVVYRPDARSQDYKERGVLSETSLIDALMAAFKTHAGRYAVSTLDRRFTYRALDEASTKLAYALAQAGLKPLDRVIFQLPNTPELVICLIACWKAGLIPICTLAAHRQHEIDYLATLAEARAHIIAADDEKFDFLGFARATRGRIASMEIVVNATGPTECDALSLPDILDKIDLAAANDFVARLPRNAWQVCTFQLSGGTTGIPKIIPRFSNEYLYQMQHCASVLALREDDTLLLPTPLLHNANMGCASIPTLLSGGQILLSRRIDARIFFQQLLKFRPTAMGVAGPLLDRFKSLGFSRRFRPTPKGVLGWILLRNLRRIISMNASREVEQTLHIPGKHIFGMTEGVIMLTREDDPEPLRHDCVGYPISNEDEVRLLRPGSEEDVAEGDVGELAVRGPYTISGYYKAEERNAEAFTSDGFYRSGDLMRAYRHGEQLHYAFEGRIKEVIDRGAEKINCEEVERALRTNPDIIDAVVVGMPNAKFGEISCAFVIPATGATAPSVRGLGRFLEEFGMAKFKWPERVVAIDALPVTKVGKLDRQPLRERAAEMAKAEQEAA